MRYENLGLIGVNELRGALEWVVEAVDTVFGPPRTGGRFVGHEGFPRTLQMDNYTCAPCCVLMVLRHFGRRATLGSVKGALGTDEDGTYTGPMVTYLRRRGLVASSRRMRVRDLEVALARGAVVIATVDGDHVAVVHGIDQRHVHLADPAFNRSIFRRVPRSRFRKRWDHEGIVVRPR
jgi:ABC-type bacteriocin/lantibiotic exporter with double-glycine peptidase domain